MKKFLILLLAASLLLLTSCLNYGQTQDTGVTEGTDNTDAGTVEQTSPDETDQPDQTTEAGQPENTTEAVKPEETEPNVPENTTAPEATTAPDNTATPDTGGPEQPDAIPDGGLTVDTDGDSRKWGEVHFPS